MYIDKTLDVGIRYYVGAYDMILLVLVVLVCMLLTCFDVYY